MQGSTSLKGQLLVSFVNGFQNSVTPSNTFTLLQTNNPVAGSFSNVISGGRLNTTDGTGSFMVNYTGNTIVLSNFGPVMAAPGFVTASAPSALEPTDGKMAASTIEPAAPRSEVPLRNRLTPNEVVATRGEARATQVKVETSDQLQDLLDSAAVSEGSGSATVAAKSGKKAGNRRMRAVADLSALSRKGKARTPDLNPSASGAAIRGPGLVRPAAVSRAAE